MTRIWVHYDAVWIDDDGVEVPTNGWEIIDIPATPWSEEDFVAIQERIVQQANAAPDKDFDIEWAIIDNWHLMEHIIQESPY